MTVVFEEAVVVSLPGEPLRVQTADPEFELDPAARDCKVIRVSPADGVPGPGELWQDAHGLVWFVRGGDRPTDERVLIGGDARGQHPGRVNESWLTVHREYGPIRRIWPAEGVGE